MLYLIGQPGAGKSTLMARLTEGMSRTSIAPHADFHPVAHDVLVDRAVGVVVGAELGRQRELFSGTDTLPSSIIERAIPWLKTVPYPLILAEGARLANKRFLMAAFDAGYAVTVALLDHPEADEWRKRRAKRIGRDQAAAWVKGRLTASRALADQLEELQSTGFTVYRGHPDALLPLLAPLVSADVQRQSV